MRDVLCQVVYFSFFIIDFPCRNAAAGKICVTADLPGKFKSVLCGQFRVFRTGGNRQRVIRSADKLDAVRLGRIHNRKCSDLNPAVLAVTGIREIRAVPASVHVKSVFMVHKVILYFVIVVICFLFAEIPPVHHVQIAIYCHNNVLIIPGFPAA